MSLFMTMTGLVTKLVRNALGLMTWSEPTLHSNNHPFVESKIITKL